MPQPSNHFTINEHQYAIFRLLINSGMKMFMTMPIHNQSKTRIIPFQTLFLHTLK